MDPVSAAPMVLLLTLGRFLPPLELPDKMQVMGGFG